MSRFEASTYGKNSEMALQLTQVPEHIWDLAEQMFQNKFLFRTSDLMLATRRYTYWGYICATPSIITFPGGLTEISAREEIFYVAFFTTK